MRINNYAFNPDQHEHRHELVSEAAEAVAKSVDKGVGIEESLKGNNPNRNAAFGEALELNKWESFKDLIRKLCGYTTKKEAIENLFREIYLQKSAVKSAITAYRAFDQLRSQAEPENRAKFQVKISRDSMPEDGDLNKRTWSYQFTINGTEIFKSDAIPYSNVRGFAAMQVFEQSEFAEILVCKHIKVASSTNTPLTSEEVENLKKSMIKEFGDVVNKKHKDKNTNDYNNTNDHSNKNIYNTKEMNDICKIHTDVAPIRQNIKSAQEQIATARKQIAEISSNTNSNHNEAINEQTKALNERISVYEKQIQTLNEDILENERQIQEFNAKSAPFVKEYNEKIEQIKQLAGSNEMLEIETFPKNDIEAFFSNMKSAKKQLIKDKTHEIDQLNQIPARGGISISSFSASSSIKTLKKDIAALEMDIESYQNLNILQYDNLETIPELEAPEPVTQTSSAPIKNEGAAKKPKPPQPSYPRPVPSSAQNTQTSEVNLLSTNPADGYVLRV